MKSTRILAGTLVATILAFTSCQKEQVVGVDPNKPAPEDIAIDLSASSDETLTIQWDITKAVAAGASSFTAQIPAEQNLGDVYNGETSITVFTKDADNNFVTFKKLKAHNQFYIRVRANYPRSVFSEWKYITVSGNPVKYEMGFGFIDSTHPGLESIDYNSSMSSTTSIAMDVDATAAESAGATGIRLQLLDRTTKVLVKESLTDIPASTVKVADLKAGSYYNVRARAEYIPDDGGITILSEWIDFQNDTTNVIKVGEGPAIPPTVPPTAREVEKYKTSSTLGFEWTETDWSSAAGDAGISCKLELFSDQGCSSLVYGIVSDNASNWGLVNGNAGEPRQPRFLFGGLKPGTKYYFRMTDTATGLSTDPIEAETSPFRIIEPSASPVAAGDTLLAEDFGQIALGTYSTVPNSTQAGKAGEDYIIGIKGSSTTDLTPEENTPNILEGGYTFAGPDGEHGCFNTMKTGLAKTRLDKWGVINEDGATNKGYICVRNGHLKMGASNLYGLLVTPELTNIERTATIKVSFRCAPFCEKMVVKERPLGQIQVIAPGASRDEYRTVSGTVIPTTCRFQMPATGVWESREFTISGVEPGSRIAIGSSREAASGYVGTPSGQARFFLDEVVIELVEYEVTVGNAVFERADMEDNKGVIVLKEAENVAEYVVKIKECGTNDDTWTEFKSTTNEVPITGLKKLTEYHVMAKTIGTNGRETEWCHVEIVRTTDKVYNYPLTIATPEDLVEWFELGANNTEKPGTAILGADIDLSTTTFDPATLVAGIVMDGNGHSITINNKPIFANIGGTVKNLVIKGILSANLGAESTTGHPFAPLSLASTGTVENVTNQVAVTLSSTGILGSPVVAGLVACQKGGTITGCTNEAAISLIHSGTANVSVEGVTRKPFAVIGGVVGVCEGGTVSNCTNNAKVSVKCNDVKSVGARHYIGGILGTPQDATVKDCHNKAEVVADFDEGVSARSSNGKQIYVGGIVGGRNGDEDKDDGGSIDNCTNDGKITLTTDYNANSYLGGICGQAQSESSLFTAKMTKCTNNGELVKNGFGGARIGGISGGAATLDGCTNNGKITVNNIDEKRAIGGLVGYPTQTKHTITNCKSLGDIECKAGTNYYVGGIGGQGGNTTQNYSGCTIKCNITTPEGCKTGLLLGTVETLASGKTITCGTAEAPLKVSGSINGTAATADNFSTMLCGSATAGGTLDTANVQFGE